MVDDRGLLTFGIEDREGPDVTEEEKKRASAILTNIEQAAGDIVSRDPAIEAQARSVRANANALRQLLALEAASH
jgi:hypothetical protein